MANLDFITSSDQIEGVQITNLKRYGDDRGQVMEIFRREWFPQVSWENVQNNRSSSVANVLRGLHYHFYQADYWHLVSGHIRAGLVDLRPHSPTYKATQLIDLRGEDTRGLFIPTGVAHGFYAVAACTLIYVVNNYYNPKDEFGVAWDDPAIGLEWDALAPMISERDATNPLLADIPAAAMPTAQIMGVTS